MNISLVWASLILFLMVVAGAVLVYALPRFRMITMGTQDSAVPMLIFFAAALIILSCIVPMGLSPVYNGEDDMCRNQYERITEAFLAGQLHFLYEVDERLLAMENPYDMAERNYQGIDYYWDHALYNGRYYMYFGVAPVLMLFLPFRVITGQPLTGYHGTQVFAAIYIAGIFMLLRMLGKKYFPKMSLSLYLLLCAATVYFTLWYAVAAPALYCMAIVSAMACAIWSVYFYVKAVFFCEKENAAIACAALGALLGALEFGCRPTVGLSNLVVLPLIVQFLKKRGISARLLLKMLLAALPYVLVAAGLMWYNHARFGNPFEFGQTYQLTVTDQTAYAGSMLDRFDLRITLRDMYFYLFNNMLSLPELEPFPLIGPFVTFPLLPVSFLLLLFAGSRKQLYQSNLLAFGVFLLASVAVIMVFDILWAPLPEPRYRLDFSWLLGIGAFILAGCGAQGIRHTRIFHGVLGAACILTIITSAILFLYPFDFNFTHYYGMNFFA